MECLIKGCFLQLFVLNCYQFNKGFIMAIAIKLSDLLVEDAKPYAQAMHRSVPKQIEYWARLGKVAEENPDLPIHMLQDMLVSIEEVKAGNLSPYQFG
jgi:ParD-like antitoxin of type II bacterial toxin-antitoxin system